MVRTDKKPWFRQPLVWMIIAIPFSAIVVGGILLWLSIDSYDGLVVDDYYKHGKEINRVLARDKRAAELGLRGQIQIQAKANTIQVNLGSGEGAELPKALELKLLHSTRAGYDEALTLAHSGQGLYITQFDGQLEKGAWNIQLGTEQWRIVGRLRIPDSPFAALKPATL